ncbi:MAG: PPC domain-containing protein [Proteobacteria bacterium]|nr:PPC domain-containing protein [Pseudomonadota bacterium]
MIKRASYGLGLAALLALTLQFATAMVGCSENNGGGGGGDDGGGGQGSCPDGVDRMINLDTAHTLAEGDETVNYICPRLDNDYYRIEVPAGKQLLRVKLQLSAPVSPINLTYLVLKDANTVVARAPEGQNNAFNALHCLAPGSYYLQVLDQGNDARDEKNSYRLSYSTEADPDSQEPNDDEAKATTVGASNSGRISCTGDRDFYKVNVAADQLLDVALTTAAPTPVDYKHTVYRLEGGRLVEVASDSNPDGSRAPTDLSTIYAVPSAGTYYVAVEDAESNDSDVATPYTLRVAARPEPDANDRGTRNDHPGGQGLGTARTIGSFTGQACTAPLELSVQGRLASLADVDYYRIDAPANLSVANPAVMEVKLAFDRATVVDSSLALLFAHEATSCSKDECCRVLAEPAARSCADALDCTDSSFSCIPKTEVFCNDTLCQAAPTATCATEKRCAGAVLCVPGAHCAAQQFARRADNGATVLTAQPMFHPGPWYLRVADFLGDEWDYDATYTLTVKVCMDPDGATDNGYYPRLITSASEEPQLDGTELDAGKVGRLFASGSRDRAKAKGDLVGTGAWVEGSIAYEHDEDSYTFDNPCKGATCMLGADYETVGTCPAGGASGNGLQFNFVISTGEGGGDFQLAAGTPGQQHFSHLAGAGCRVLLRPPGGGASGSADTLRLYVSDLLHNSWSWSCRYRVRLVKIGADGCPVPPCATQVTSGVCYAP